MKIVLLIFVVMLTSCSTIDRRTYFSPLSESGTTSGPERPYCGMHQFSKEPNKVAYGGLTYKANESYEPYFWGPWLITIVPVFPITWIADVFVDSNLELTITAPGENSTLPPASAVTIIASLNKGGEVHLKHESASIRYTNLFIKFPIKSNKIKSFSIKVDDEHTDIEFTKTARWSWTQICVN